MGGLLVASHPILERGGAMICIGTTEVVARPMTEVGVSEVTPALRRSIGGTGACMQSAPLWGR